MKIVLKLATMFTVMVAALSLLGTTPTFARGGAQNIMNSPGYQRALKESRENYARRYYGQPYTQQRSVYPGRKWRHRAWRRHRY